MDWPCLASLVVFAFQIGGRPLLALRHAVLREPLSVCEQRPDEGPQGVPDGRSHPAALLQMAEGPPDGVGWIRLCCQGDPVPGEKGGREGVEAWIYQLVMSGRCFSERSQL